MDLVNSTMAQKSTSESKEGQPGSPIENIHRFLYWGSDKLKGFLIVSFKMCDNTYEAWNNTNRFLSVSLMWGVVNLRQGFSQIMGFEKFHDGCNRSMFHGEAAMYWLKQKGFAFLKKEFGFVDDLRGILSNRNDMYLNFKKLFDAICNDFSELGIDFKVYHDCGMFEFSFIDSILKELGKTTLCVYSTQDMNDPKVVDFVDVNSLIQSTVEERGLYDSIRYSLYGSYIDDVRPCDILYKEALEGDYDSPKTQCLNIYVKLVGYLAKHGFDSERAGVVPTINICPIDGDLYRNSVKYFYPYPKPAYSSDSDDDFW